MAELVIYPALYMGVIIGLYELILVHRDENFRGSHWLGHGLHAVAWAMAAIFAVMNVPYIFTLFPGLANIKFIGNELVFRIAIGLVTMIKIHSAAAVIKAGGGMGRTIGQTWAHSFIIAALIVASPYIWPLLEPVVANYLPT